MNQTKMDEYKEYKKNRKEILAKQKKSAKVRRTAWTCGLAAIALALLIALGVTGYNTVYNYVQAKPDYNRTEAVISDVVGVLDVTEAETTAAETTTAAQ